MPSEKFLKKYDGEKMQKIGMISLGCSKNRVDSEHMLHKLSENGFEITETVDDADAVIINTCAFIEDAKKEAIENILDMAELKKEGVIKKIIVTGCLSERYHNEIKEELPEVDGIITLGAEKDIVKAVDEILTSDKTKLFEGAKKDLPLSGGRILTTPHWYSYLKISDGCSNGCSYCAIPKIRGGFRSKPFQEIIDEAKFLADEGTKELIVIAQDTGRYGEDLYGERRLPELLSELCKIEKLCWIRVLYIYPETISDELLRVFAENEKLLNYFDIPFQHASAKILKAMRRQGSLEINMTLCEKIRKVLPDATLRTTLMTGFPGETDEDFEKLSEFVKKSKFDRLGCFTYSKEEGTLAANMDNQIADDIKKQRGENIMDIQFRIFTQKNEENIGKILETVVENYDGYTDTYIGRTWRDAPEIDGIVNFTSTLPLENGDMVKVKIIGTNDYDLIGAAYESAE